ncbi:DUF5989 family protein [Algibacter miyuki]|uniref:DUF5989 family protein n=1 Tax=Algibacter miyuki TaxID=1306933 RepID=A0ABV5GWQ6_9FLAO|nr:DUF5989 family protein [Algibacter miyuki]MDN3664275.1 DUF5989 family protein [Algibacter miyuki]
MSKYDTVKQLGVFLIKQKKFWLIPIVIVLILLTFLVVFAENSVIAPFVYTLF